MSETKASSSNFFAPYSESTEAPKDPPASPPSEDDVVVLRKAEDDVSVEQTTSKISVQIFANNVPSADGENIPTSEADKKLLLGHDAADTARSSQTTTLNASNDDKAENATNESENSEPKAPRLNPFAQFAASGSSLHKRPTDLPQWLAPPKKTKPNPPQKSAAASSSSSSWIRMRDLPASEQERIVIKWHSLVRFRSNSSGAPRPCLEDSRFHILVAARLHARCQEGPVRQAMQALYRHWDGKLTVQTLATADPEDWKDVIRNLQYYATKARQLQKAAREILQQFNGQVPEMDQDLRKLTGIGPVLADLLAFVNLRQVHHQQRGQSQDVAA